MLPSFPHTHVQSLTTWSNYTGTIAGRSVPIYCTPEGGITPAVLRVHGDAIRAILRHCFTQTPPLKVRTIGSTWSFSKVIEPGRVIIDPGNMTYMERIPAEHFSASYRARADQGFVPVFVEGGTGISSINRRLGRDLGLALQTSGAGDGHRIGGCIATGTHGSALGIGALHDTVLALYLIVAPDRALFIQRGTDSPFAEGAVAWLAQQTGIPTSHVANDLEFHAALVSLGSFGFVFGVVLEATQLYRFKIQRSMHRPDHPDVLRAIRTLDTAPLHPQIAQRPYHFDVVMHPYPHGMEPGLFVTLMWKQSPANVPFASPLPGIPRTSSDTMGLLASFVDALGGTLAGPLTLAVLQQFISSQLSGDCKPEVSELFPGQVFGPTTLPPGTGASTEIIVDHAQAGAAIDTVFEVLHAQRQLGNFLLGCVAVRFVPKTRALLGMNQHDMNCFIELPSIRNNDVLEIYEAVWNAFEQKGIPFTCHWGQLGGFTPQRVERYFGQNVANWKAARRALLLNDETAMHVFASGILQDAGLDG